MYRRRTRSRYQTQSAPDSRPDSRPRGPAALVPCTCSGPAPATTRAQPTRGQGAASRLRRASPDPTTGRITAAMTANPPGIHST